MVKITKIYTRTGDDGATHLIGGTRVSKGEARIEALGAVDELNAWLGIIRTTLALGPEEIFRPLGSMLEKIQNRLFDIGALLAAPDSDTQSNLPTPLPQDVQELEEKIDALNGDLQPLSSFVLPGGTMLNSYCHIARTVCRRAERRAVALHELHPVPAIVLQYLNRLSDLLFAAARWAILKEGQQEFLWHPQLAPK